MPKATHILSADSRSQNFAHDPLRTPVFVYGEEDLQTRLAAAKERGVEVIVTPINGTEEG